jgi:hypothetical protein
MAQAVGTVARMGQSVEPPRMKVEAQQIVKAEAQQVVEAEAQQIVEAEAQQIVFRQIFALITASMTFDRTAYIPVPVEEQKHYICFYQTL